MLDVRVGLRRWWRGLLLAVSIAALAGLAPSGALAGKGVVSVFGASGTGDGEFSGAAGALAVNTSSGDVYVADPEANRVEEFDADGSFLRTWGWGVATGAASFETCTSGCQAGNAGSGDGQFDGPAGIAIDQSDGAVYVVDANNSRVEKFDASGAYLAQFGAPGAGDGEFSGPQGAAVDPTDRSVYIADAANNRVEKFDNSGAYVSQFGTAGSGDGEFSFPTRVAVDSTGQVYVLDAGNGRIQHFTAGGAFDSVFGAADVFLPSEIAVGPGNDHLYVAQWAQDFSEQHVIELDSGGALVDTHGVGSTASNPSGLGLNAASARIYLADGFNSRVFILEELAAPTVSIDPASNVTSDSADLSGTVNPNGPPAVGWHFESSTDGIFWGALGPDQDAGSGTSGIPVSGSMSDLVPNTTYFVRLIATRPFNAPTASTPIQFMTVALAPDVETLPANDISTTHATFRGTIHAHNAATTYRFEYGTTTAYGSNFPAGGADGGSRNALLEVMQRIDTLKPGTTYHYRIVAENAAGSAVGDDETFTTTTPLPASSARPGIPGPGFLPDDRVWELVSPPDKHGNDVMADSTRTRAASDGSAVSFSSLGAFADAPSLALATDYLSVRTGQLGTTGWATHAITPKQDPLTFLAVIQSRDPLYVGELSPDLSAGVFQAWSPVTDDPDVAKVNNIYLRRDLRTAGAGSYELLSGCPACGATPLPSGTGARLVGASADFSHVAFESNSTLTSDTPACPVPPAFAAACPFHLYEWDHGIVRLAGIMPDGTAAPSSIAGKGMAGSSQYTPHVISADGRRIFFTDNTGASDRFSGKLYMRENHSSTVQINASERTPPDPSPQSATYWDASRDGSRAFFTTIEQLTNDDNNSVADLYMYDANAPANHHLSRLSIDHHLEDLNGTVDGVIGVSDDGRYVYFIARGQLVEGGPNVAFGGIYLWHDGDVSYVGESFDIGREPTFDLPQGWALSPLASRVSPDGKHLLYTSWGDARAGLTGYDQSCPAAEPCRELYLFDATSKRWACASCDPTDTQPTGDAEIFVRRRTGAATTTWHVMHALSDDGRRVFFTTPDALVPQDSNGKADVYEYDAPTATVHLLSSGRDPADSYLMDVSSDGSDVFFLTRARLVGWDVDQSYDLYDARVGGGLPEPAGRAPVCSGEGCKGPAGAALGAGTPSSSAFHGTGNKKRPDKPRAGKRPKKCRHGFVRKRVKVHGKRKIRCVKAHRRPRQIVNRGIR